MRIISGLFKGKKILQPLDKQTRPLKDLTKESIFNIIEHSNKFSTNIKNSNVLDLFSGVGSFGLECLSREAQHVTFVENYNNVLPILKKNLSNLKNKNNYKIFSKDINFETENYFKKKMHFDIIFMDPPFKNKNLEKILNDIHNNGILKKGGILVIHRHKKEEDDFPKSFQILEKKFYGISKIIFGNF